MTMEETYFWSTLVLGIGFVLLLILFLYKMFISPRQVIVSLEKASRGILVSDASNIEDGSKPAVNSGQLVERQSPGKSQHNWARHLILSLTVLSLLLGFMLGWEFDNNIYAQEWVAQNLAEVGLIAFIVIMGVILLPLAMIVIMGVLRRQESSASGS